MTNIDLTNKTEDEITEIVNKCNNLQINESFSIPEGTIKCLEFEKIVDEEEEDNCVFSGINCNICNRIKCMMHERKDNKNVEFIFTYKRKNSKNR